VSEVSKVFNALSTSRQYFAKKCFQLSLENVETFSAESPRLSGREFQVDGPTTAKHRRP